MIVSPPSTGARPTLPPARRGYATPADELIFPYQGRIVARGSHDELVALGGRYRELYDLQARPEDTAPLHSAGGEG